MYQVTQWVISSPPVLICSLPSASMTHHSARVLESAGTLWLWAWTPGLLLPLPSGLSDACHLLCLSAFQFNRKCICVSGWNGETSWHFNLCWFHETLQLISLSTTPMGSARIYRFVSTPCCFHVRSKPNYVWMQITAQTYVYLHLQHI